MRARPGGAPPTLLRVVNANYHPTLLRLTGTDGAPAPIAELIAHDGRPFRDTSTGPPFLPLTHPAGARLMTDRLAFGAAERFDLLLRPEAGEAYTLHVDWYHWVPQSRASRLGSVSIPLVDA